MDASTANSRFRVTRTVEEESALVREARPSSTKSEISGRWKFFVNGKGREHLKLRI